jgi:hypothetical protein
MSNNPHSSGNYPQLDEPNRKLNATRAKQAQARQGEAQKLQVSDYLWSSKRGSCGVYDGRVMRKEHRKATKKYKFITSDTKR